MFDLQRLEKKTRIFKFPGIDGNEIEIGAHYPTPHEIAAALSDAGADLDRALEITQEGDNQKINTLEALDLSAKMGGAIEALACYCIDFCSAFPIKKIKSKHSLRRISEEAEEKLAPILDVIGNALYAGVGVSEAEGEV